MTEEVKSNPITEIKSETQQPILQPITETKSVIDKADAVALRMETANKRAEELLTRQEAIVARMMLSGRSEAGQQMKTADEIQADKIKAEAEAITKQFFKK